MQFKLEGQAIQRHPEFEMDDRMLLDKLSHDKRTVEIDGQNYRLTNDCFQLVNPANPYQIQRMEQAVLIDLINQFTRSSKLNEQMWFMLDNGSIYAKHNGNLLFHGCIPVDTDGNFLEWKTDGRVYSGKKLCDYFDEIVRDACQHPTTGDCLNSDLLWYLFEGAKSPLFGKDKMRTFERYFIKDEDIQKEKLNPYYELRQEDWFADKLMNEFDVGAGGHIVNGYTPVDTSWQPVLANGKILVINGGLSPVSDKADIGGHTLLFDSHGLKLVTLKPFISREKAIADMTDAVAMQQIIVNSAKRVTVRNTGVGEDIKKQLDDLYDELDS